MSIYGEAFDRAVVKLLAHEGGYVKDPRDPGGETNYGISKRTYPTLDIKALTRASAIALYHADWWERHGYGKIADPELAAKMFDFAVNMGASRAHMILQEAVNETSTAGLCLDGWIGPQSLEAINNHPHPQWLLAAYRLGAVAFYVSLSQSRYLAGWVSRALD